MTYTNNTPQAGQTISETQPLILDNFGFIDNAIGQEHNFDASDATATYHLQASMPNMADPGALPASTDGMYYVSSGVPKFYNTSPEFLMISKYATLTQSGTVNLSTVQTSIGSALTQYTAGIYFIIPPVGEAAANHSAVGFFVTGASDSGTTVYPSASNNGDPGIIISSSGNSLRAALNSNPAINNFKYLIFQFGP